MNGLLLTAESTAIDWSPLTNALTSSFSTGEILSLMGTVVAAGAGFVLVWFGGRKIVNDIIRAFKSGKLKV